MKNLCEVKLEVHFVCPAKTHAGQKRCEFYTPPENSYRVAQVCGHRNCQACLSSKARKAALKDAKKVFDI